MWDILWWICCIYILIGSIISFLMESRIYKIRENLILTTSIRISVVKVIIFMFEVMIFWGFWLVKDWISDRRLK